MKRGTAMTKEELATKLNGREYMGEITKAEEQEAKESGLVVVFGASDDLIEFRGAIRDEAYCSHGSMIAITKEGLPKNECGDSDCPYFMKYWKSLTKIKALFDSNGYSWQYEAPFPVARFDIMEDEEKYCQGIVFELSSLDEGAQ